MQIRASIPVSSKRVGAKSVPIRTSREEKRPAVRDVITTNENQGVYVISIAARLLQMHPQTLRKYERLGLVSPSRSLGMLRLYSDEDISRIRLVRTLHETIGLNLAGVEMVLRMQEVLEEMRHKLEALHRSSGTMSSLRMELDRLWSLMNGELDENEDE